MRSSVLRFVVRTKLADVDFASADTKIRIKNVSIKELIEQTLRPHGVMPSDIEYRCDAAREVMTGRPTKGGKPAKDLAALTEQQAAVQPGETNRAFLDRHLRRHGLLIWDGADGKIVVGEPDDVQEPLYQFRCLRGPEGQFNNFTSTERTFDVSGVPTSVTAFGTAGGADFRRSKVSARLVNEELTEQLFHRPVLIVDDGMKTNQLAQRTVAREFAERLRRSDYLPIVCDSLGYADRVGGDRPPFVVDTCAEIITSTGGGSIGKYYIEEVQLSRDPRSGDAANLTAVKAGTWIL
jgi:prophage tail gpP-like protein